MTAEEIEQVRLTQRLDVQLELFKVDADVIGTQPTKAGLFYQLQSLRKQLDSIEATYDQIERSF